MAYDGKVMREALQRFEEDKQRRASQTEARRQRIYREIPRLEAIEKELRGTMARIMTEALRHGEDPAPACVSARRTPCSSRSGRSFWQSTAMLPTRWRISPAAPSAATRATAAAKCAPACKSIMPRSRSRASAACWMWAARALTPSVWSGTTRSPASPQLMERNLAVCQRYAAHFGEKPENLLLDGAPGLGKTFLSACIARVVSEDGFSVVYDTAVHVFARCESAKFRGDEEPDAAVDVLRYESCDLLILDDLGTEMTTNFVQSALYQLVNGRLLAGKSTIISTNLTPAQLESRYGAAIWSRLQGEYTVLAFAGEDIRKLKRMMR